MNVDIGVAIQIVLALVSVGAWLLNKRESKARIANMTVLTEKTQAEIDKIAIDQNLTLFQQLQSERADNEKAQKRISKDLVDLREDLRITNQSLANASSREIHLTDELNRYKKAYEDLIAKQNTMEQRQVYATEVIQQHEGEIEKMKRKTGDLPTQTPFTPDQLK